MSNFSDLVRNKKEKERERKRLKMYMDNLITIINITNLTLKYTKIISVY